MSFSFRLLYLAILQLILTAFVTYYLITDEYRKLSNESVNTLETFLIEQKKQELKNYTSLATSAVQHISVPEKEAVYYQKQRVAQVLNSLLFNGQDGYFFVYDGAGNGISHPKEPFRVGKNWWELENNKGEKVIQILIRNAKAGGGFYQYPWHKPSSDAISEKISYSLYLEKLDWMLGTGIYLDDVHAQLNKLQQKIDQHIAETQKIILLVTMTSIALLFVVGLFIHLNQKRKNELTIDKLGQKIINLQEDERRHISRELHDGIIQIMVSIKYSIEATGLYLKKQQQHKPKPLIQAEINLATAIAEIRRISHHLHPRVLDELGLSSAIDSLSTEFADRTKIRVKFSKPAVRNILPANISTTLYRTVQEALTNVEKHAQASLVAINLNIDKKWLVLEIIDDGKGFDTASKATSANSGIGLRNLAERIQYHNGVFKYASSQVGTTIKAKIPTASFANYFSENDS
jgi:two-component system NarL family sensor kinase